MRICSKSTFVAQNFFNVLGCTFTTFADEIALFGGTIARDGKGRTENVRRNHVVRIWEGHIVVVCSMQTI